MDVLLVPDTPAGQRLTDTTAEIEPSCCSPIRSKLNTTPIKLFSIIYIVCGALLIGLGVVACIFGCLYNGLSIPAGVAFIATGVIGLCVRRHGGLAIAYSISNLLSFVWGVILLVYMLKALPFEETWHERCSSYDCKHRQNNCCSIDDYVLEWKNVAIDLSILVVGVVSLVTSLLATTLSLRDTNWVKLCCLKKNMNGTELVLNSAQTNSAADQRSALSCSSPAMKRCWKPCDGKRHFIATIILSVIHIIIGVISVGLGVAAVFFGEKYAHMAIPIWSGLLIFIVTGVYGLLSAIKKGSYIPCFFALSILAFVLSINMLVRPSVSIAWGEYYYDNSREWYGCLEWGCSISTTTATYPRYPSYYSYGCYDCLPGCCEMGYRYIPSEAFFVGYLIIGFGVLEMMICMATFALSFSQLSCYFCCRQCTSNCNCCKPKNKDQYQMVMTSDGNLMMVAVPNAHHGFPTIVHNHPMMVQHQPMLIAPNQHTGQNQPIAAQGSPAMGTNIQNPLEQQGHGQLMVGGQGHPTLAQEQGQLMFVQSRAQPMMVQSGQGQQMMLQQGQGQPMMVQQGQGQPMMVQQGQGQPMMVQQGQGQPMMVQQGQGQPMMVQQGQGRPMNVQQGQSQPMFLQQPFVQGMGQVAMDRQPTNQSIVVSAQGQQTNQPPMIVTYGQPTHAVQLANQPVLVGTQGQPTNQPIIVGTQGQQTNQPMVVATQGQPMIVGTEGQPTNQLVVATTQGLPLMVGTQDQLTNQSGMIGTQDQPVMDAVQDQRTNQPVTAAVQGQ